MKNKILCPLALILVFALSRWPGVMPQNFSAAYALVFCGGLYLPGWLAWAAPLGVMAATDLVLTFFHYHPAGYSFFQFARDQAPNYAAYALLIALGAALGRKKRNWATLVSGGIFGAILFYLITNTASWMSDSYPKTLAGWIQALTIGLPGYPPTWEFLRNTLLSGGIFSALFVGAMKFGKTTERETAPLADEKKADEEETELAPATESPESQTGSA